MITKYEKANKGKLLVAVLALFVVLAGAAVVFSDSEVSATDGNHMAVVEYPGDATKGVTSTSEISGPGDFLIKGNFTIDKDFTLGANQTLYIGAEYDENTGGAVKFTVQNGATLTVEGTIYNNVGKNALTSSLVIEGKLVFSGEGAMYSTCAVSSGSASNITGFFTNSNGATGVEYKHMYSADITKILPYVNDVGYSDEGDLEEATAKKAIFTYGDVVIDKNVTIPTEQTLYVGGVGGQASEVTVTKTLTVEGTVTNSKDATSYTIVNNGKIITSLDAVGNSKVDVPISPTSTGTLTTQSTSNAYLGGTVDKTSTTTEFGSGQIVNIVDDLIIDGAKITIKGVLNVPAEYSITIINGGSLTITSNTGVLNNEGTISVETDNTSGSLAIKDGAKVVNNGTVNFAVDDASASASSIEGVFTNNGTVNIEDGKNSKVTYPAGATFINTADGILNINGELQMDVDSGIQNAGIVNIDGTLSGNDKIFNNTTDGAVINVISTDSTIRIVDDALTDYGKNKVEVGNNFVRVEYTGKGVVGGLVVKSVVTESDDKYYKSLDVSGTPTITTEVDSENAKIQFSGKTTVSATLTIDETIGIQVAGDLTVSGQITATDNAAKIDVIAENLGNTVNTGNVIVTGTITKAGDAFTGSVKFFAASYTLTEGANKTTYYSTLENAVASSATKINVTGGTGNVDADKVVGGVTVNGELTIPAGVTVTVDTGAIMVVGTDGYITVADGAKIDNKGEIYVNGTLYYTVEKTGLKGSGYIYSEVKSQGETDVKYTSLANAITDAGSETVTITLNGNVKITSALTIPSNVTVDTATNGFEVYGAALTIDGTLYLNGTTIGNTAENYWVHDNTEGNIKKTASVTLNGYIKSDSTMDYNDALNGTGNDAGKMFPAGAYYEAADGNETYNYITSVANSTNIASQAVNGVVSIYGENTVGDIAYTGTEEDPVEVTVYGKLTAGTITLQYATLAIENIEFNGTVATAEGSVAITSATVNGEFVSEAVDEAMTFTVSGSITSVDAKKYSATYAGAVSVGVLNTTGMTVDGTVTVIENGATLGTVTVNGNLVADNGIEVTVTDLSVFGTVTAEAATETEAQGTIDVTGTLYVGLTKDDVVKPGATSTVTGAVSYGTMYVANGSTVPEDMTKDVDNTEYYIEDTLWMTAYKGDASTTPGINAVTNAPVENAIFNGWLKDDMKTKVTSSDSIGAAGFEKVYADVNYKIYSIVITTDNGIGSVAIDGQVMIKGAFSDGEISISNAFYLSNLTAGDHEVTYQLKSGYEGTATLSIDGTAVSGYNINLSGVEDLTVLASLTGTTPIDYSQAGTSDDSGMGLVEILLVILVVVVVILAIIVVLRMMRS